MAAFAKSWRRGIAKRALRDTGSGRERRAQPLIRARERTFAYRWFGRDHFDGGGMRSPCNGDQKPAWHARANQWQQTAKQPVEKTCPMRDGLRTKGVT